MTSRRMLPALALLSLGACAIAPPPAAAWLPADAVEGAGDPLRSAIANASSTFAATSRLRGRPADAARALAQMEYLAVELPGNPRIQTPAATLGAEMETARREWRAVLGIAPDARPQAVIDSLYGAARALRAGRQDAAVAALPESVFRRGAAAALARLADLPPLPATNAAAVSAAEVLRRNDGVGRGRL